MGKPVAAMIRTNDAAGALGGRTQEAARAGRHRADALLDQRPTRFDGVEVIGVRWQEAHGRPRRFDCVADPTRFVGGQVIEHDDIASSEARHQASLHPGEKPWRVHRRPAGRQGQPPVDPHGPDHRQVLAPVHGARFNQLGAAREPRVRPPHGEIRARFVEKHPPSGIYDGGPGVEGRAFVLDPCTIELRRPRPFFLKTYPRRCSARSTLDRWTRAVGDARWLYARVSSPVVWSGRASTNCCSSARSTGEVHPPPLASGSTTPVVRWRRTHRGQVATPSSNRAATTAYASVPASYACTARARSAVG